MKSSQRKNIFRRINIFVAVIGTITAISLVLLVGFYWDEKTLNIFLIVNNILISAFILQEGFRWFVAGHLKKHLKIRWLENIFALLMLFTLFFPDQIVIFTQFIFPEFTVKQLTLLFLGIVEGSLIFVFAIDGLRYSKTISKIDLNPGSVFALSFVVIISIGTLFLLLPRMTVGEPLSFVDALFTSTSAVCVTGLIVVDTATEFTSLGKVFILLLIQIGGLGVMTLTTFFAFVFAGGVSVKVRLLIREMLSEESMGQIAGLLKRITAFTFITEFIGVIFLYTSMGGSFIDINRDYLYSSIFHSVSAFCNAGFSIYSSGLADPLVNSNASYLSTIMILIILGGIGFAVIANLSSVFSNEKRNIRFKYRLKIATKVVLITTGVLLLGGAIMAFFSNDWSGLSINERIFHSIFLSVTSRTAGFNTIPTEGLAAPLVLILIILMWIGASPGSTGGGIKTTTFAISILALFNYITGKEKVEIFHREVSSDSIKRAFMVITASLVTLGIGSIILVWIEPDKQPIDLLFEATSAISTVGLSRDITFHLGTGSKYLITALMFIGRIGVLTFFLSFHKPKLLPKYELPQENIRIG